MAFQRVVERKLPGGETARVYPFHISLEGLEGDMLCREEEDYDVVERLMFTSAWKCNVLIVMHVVMSNHGHLGVLARGLESVRELAECLKQKCGMFLRAKYGVRKALKETSADIQLLDTDRYVRNAFAYIAHNVADTGRRLEDYPWCSYRGMFTNGSLAAGVKSVRSLTRREREYLFHTHEKLSDVPWLLDRNDRLIPASCCDWQYLESAFNHDQTFFLKCIGQVNRAEMDQLLIENHHRYRSDAEFIPTVNEIADRWFNKTVFLLAPEQKTRLIPYLYRCYRTSTPQLARCLQMSREEVGRILTACRLVSRNPSEWRG